MGNRFLGELHMETSAYGFLKNVRTANGNGKHADVFVRVSEAKTTLGSCKNLLKRYNGSTLSFEVQPSQIHQGKVEAAALMDVEHRHRLFA